MTPTSMSTRRVVPLALALALAAALPVAAQTGIDLEARGGLAVPAGDLNEVGATGGSFGLGLVHDLTDRLSLRVDGDVELLSERIVGNAVVMPRTFLWHYHAGLELAVVRGADSPWRVSLRGGAGGTTYDTEPFVKDGDDFIDTYVSVNGGVAIGRQVKQSLEVGVVGQSYVVFTDEDRTGELAARSARLNAFSKASSFPVGIYVRWLR